MPEKTFRIALDSPGALCIVTRPRGGDWLDDDVSGMARSGVRVLVSLLEADEQHELGLDHELDACSKSSIDFISLPVPDRGTPDDSAQFVRAAHSLADLLREGSCVAIHCRQSVGRAGLLAVATALSLGIPLETALDIVSTARGVRVPETREQETWLQHNAHLFVENASDG